MAKKLWSALTITVLLAPGLLIAQPTLESLWPNTNGLVWNYQLTFESTVAPDYVTTASFQLWGTVETPGGPAQYLLTGEAEHSVQKSRAAGRDPVVAAVWRARPDLRSAIQARYGEVGSTDRWSPILIHDGYYMKGASNIQMWQDWDHPTWTYLTDALGVGATFTHQLVPELAPDVYLHGTVEALDVSISTPAGSFTNAVRVHYRIDYGWREISDEVTTLGRYRSETRGDVHYAPGVGPVALTEEYIPLLELECYVPEPDYCFPFDPGWEVGRVEQTITMSLLNLPVSITPQSWSRVKQLYRP